MVDFLLKICMVGDGLVARMHLEFETVQVLLDHWGIEAFGLGSCRYENQVQSR